jgi:hypothetical protein
MTELATGRALAPLAYHRDVTAWLREAEPEIWTWARSRAVEDQQIEDMRATMLRNSYRLEPESHPDVHAACRAAMASLDMDAPVTLYQAADGAMNASLFYMPGEICLVFYGPILERLSPDELLALLGHELAHYRLWAAEEGAFVSASRILDQALSYPDAAASHFETARLFGLHTELYADRGAAIAAGGPHPAIATLVKVMTGLSNVDPAAYLRQAAELEAGGGKSTGDTHPEIFLRAQALDKWWNGADDLEDWLERRVCGPLSISALDLPRQKVLTRLTRSFFTYFLADPSLCSEEVLTQVRRFFPDWTEDETRADLETLFPDALDDATRDYFIALMFDCATADPDARDEILAAGARTAKAFGGLDQFKTALRRDLKFTKAAADKLAGQAGRAAS